jgi:hypothetical protein
MDYLTDANPSGLIFGCLLRPAKICHTATAAFPAASVSLPLTTSFSFAVNIVARAFGASLFDTAPSYAKRKFPGVIALIALEFAHFINLQVNFSR